MEFYPTAIVVQPNETIKKEVWNQFVCEFPKCSNEYKLSENQQERHKFLSALMIANTIDSLISWQQLEKLHDIYELLKNIANDILYKQSMQQYILNLIKSFNTILYYIQPFDSHKLDKHYEHHQKIQIVQDYLQKSRKYIYSLLQNEEGINDLFNLSKGITLSVYLMSKYNNIKSLEGVFKTQTKEEIIKKLINDGFVNNPKNHFILEDYEVIPISHLFSFPFNFFINEFDPQNNCLIKRKIHQLESEEKLISFLFNIQQNSFTIRVLQSTQDIIYIQNIINQKQNLFQIKPMAVVEQIQQIIQNILNQAILDFSNINKFWIIKMLQIIQKGETQSLVANKQAIKIADQFKRETFNLFQNLNFDIKLYEEFILISEENLQKTEELMENIIISQITIIRNQITEMVNNQKGPQPQPTQRSQITSYDKVSVPKYLVNNSLFQCQVNQTPTYFQQQKKLNQEGRIVPKDLDNDLPNNSDSSERELKNKNEIQANNIQNIPVVSKEYDADNEIEIKKVEDKQQQQVNNQMQQQCPSDELTIISPPKYQNFNNKFRSEIMSQRISSKSKKKNEQAEKKRQKSVDNTDFEANLKLQNDYLISNQNRPPNLKAQSEINVLHQLKKQSDSLIFEPKKQIINQQNKKSSSIIIRQNIKNEQKEKIPNDLYQSHLSEALNESKSEISMNQNWFCPICFTQISQPELIRNLHDDHYVCKSCLEDWIKVKFNAGQWNFKFFKCPIQLIQSDTMRPCEHIIEQSEIKNTLTAEEFSKLTERAMKHGIIDIICPNLSCKANIKGMTPQNENGFLCPICNHKICWVCKNSDHGDSKCPQRLDEIKVALQDERVSCCPSCLEIYMKNDGCEHVSCNNCLIEFCFSCSAHRPPIIGHGAHYHRVGCQYRQPWWDQNKKIENLDEEYDPNGCEYCQRDQKPCPRPMSLADFKNLAHLNF